MLRKFVVLRFALSTFSSESPHMHNYTFWILYDINFGPDVFHKWVSEKLAADFFVVVSEHLSEKFSIDLRNRLTWKSSSYSIGKEQS